jgi:hypothetical protein
MRFAPVKTEEQQAALMPHPSRQLLIDRRTAVANSALAVRSPNSASS